MRKYLFSLVVLIPVSTLVLLNASSCKFRGASRLSSVNGTEVIKQMAQITEAYTTYKTSANITMHAGAFTEVLDELTKQIHDTLYDLSRDGVTYSVRTYAGATLARVASEGDMTLPRVKVKGTQYLYTDVVKMGLESFKAPQRVMCSSGGGAMSVCSDFGTCAVAIQNLAEALPYIADSEHLDPIASALGRDVECLPYGALKEILRYKVKSLSVWKQFHAVTKIDNAMFIGTTPTAEPYFVTNLANELDSLIKQSSSTFLHPRYKEFIKTGFLRSLMYEMLGDSVPKNDYDDELSNEILNKYLGLDDDALDEFHGIIDDLITAIINTHESNQVLRIYLDRLNLQDPTSWLSCLKTKTAAWKKTYDSEMSKSSMSDSDHTGGCSQSAFSHELALKASYLFLSKEMVLPFRKQWYNTMEQIIYDIPRDIQAKYIKNDRDEFGKLTGVDMFQNILNEASSYMKMTDQLLQSFLADMGAPTTLIAKEATIAKYLNNFHSLLYQVIRSTKAIQRDQRIIEHNVAILDPSSAEEKNDMPQMDLVGNIIGPAGESKKKDYSKDEMKRALEAANLASGSLAAEFLKFACYDYRFGEAGNTTYSLPGSDKVITSYSSWSCLSGIVHKMTPRSVLGLSSSKEVDRYSKAPIRNAIGDFFEWGAQSVGLGGLVNAVDHPFNEHLINYRPSNDGSYPLQNVCSIQRSDGKYDNVTLENRIGLWLLAEQNFKDCIPVTKNIKATALSIVTLPLFSFGAATALSWTYRGLNAALKFAPKAAAVFDQTAKTTITSMLLSKFPQVGTSALGLTRLVMTNPVARTIFLKETMKRAPMAVLNAFVAGTIFGLAYDVTFYSAGINETVFSSWDSYIMGSAIMGLMPIMHKTSRTLGSLSASVFNKKSLQFFAALSTSTATEVVFFASIPELVKGVHNVAGALGISKVDSQLEGLMTEQTYTERFLHALGVSLVFKLGFTKTKINKDRLGEYQSYKDSGGNIKVGDSKMFTDVKRMLDYADYLKYMRSMKKSKVIESIRPDMYRAAYQSAGAKLVDNAGNKVTVDEINRQWEVYTASFHPANYTKFRDEGYFVSGRDQAYMGARYEFYRGLKDVLIKDINSTPQPVKSIDANYVRQYDLEVNYNHAN